jgi:hypothetical protein
VELPLFMHARLTYKYIHISKPKGSQYSPKFPQCFPHTNIELSVGVLTILLVPFPSVHKSSTTVSTSHLCHWRSRVLPGQGTYLLFKNKNDVVFHLFFYIEITKIESENWYKRRKNLKLWYLNLNNLWMTM